MEPKPWYPKDFTQALSNTLSEEEVSQHLRKPGSAPRFVYGVLMLPTVLRYYIGANAADSIELSMAPATLSGYQLYEYAESSAPVIARSPDPQAAVEGILVFGLTDRQRNAIYELEGGLAGLVNVEVEICQRDRWGVHQVCPVEAGAFAWQGSRDGLVCMRGAAWSVDGFLGSPLYENMAQSQRRAAMELSAC